MVSEDEAESRCTVVRESVSANLDGEPAPLPVAEVRRHLDDCEPCRGFEAAVRGVTRRTRVAAAAPVPDLTAPILAACSELPRHSGDRRVRDLRVLVGLAGVAQLLLAVPLVLGTAGPELHMIRDLGAVQLAIGVGLIVAALDPSRARGLLPVVMAVVATLAFTVGIDLATGRAEIIAELTHLTEIVGAVALWALARRDLRAATLRPRPVS